MEKNPANVTDEVDFTQILLGDHGILDGGDLGWKKLTHPWSFTFRATNQMTLFFLKTNKHPPVELFSPPVELFFPAVPFSTHFSWIITHTIVGSQIRPTTWDEMV